MFIVFGRDISLILRTHEISLLKNNSHDLHRVITHSLVLVILCCNMACVHVISISLMVAICIKGVYRYMVIPNYRLSGIGSRTDILIPAVLTISNYLLLFKASETCEMVEFLTSDS